MKQPQLCIIAIMLAAVALGAPQGTFAQAPAAGDTAAQAPVKLGAAELQKLVAPIALYPDALLAHVLPASTAGMDVVAAARFLRKNNGKAEPKPDAKWNTSVFVLLQFPDVLYRMDENLEWTDNLGKAVLAQQADVMKAIQEVRTTAMANGALQTNDKQKVVVEQEAVTDCPGQPPGRVRAHLQPDHSRRQSNEPQLHGRGRDRWVCCRRGCGGASGGRPLRLARRLRGPRRVSGPLRNLRPSGRRPVQPARRVRSTRRVGPARRRGPTRPV